MTKFSRRLPGIFKAAAVCAVAATLAACAGSERVAGDPAGYCYRTLGQVDCYTTPEKNRVAIAREPKYAD